MCVLAQLQQSLLCQDAVNLPVSLQRVEILDAEAPGFAMNQLLYCHFFVLSETSLLRLYRENSEDISTKTFISGAWQLHVALVALVFHGFCAEVGVRDPQCSHEGWDSQERAMKA